MSEQRNISYGELAELERMFNEQVAEALAYLWND